MITEYDLQEAIAECNGKRNPDASTCIKLAAFYTIKEHLYPDAARAVISTPAYSFAADPQVKPTVSDIVFNGQTEFANLIDGKRQADIWPIIEELVTAVQALHPRLYGSFIDRLR